MGCGVHQRPQMPCLLKVLIMETLSIYISTRSKQYADEDNVVRLKVADQLLNGPWGELVFSTCFNRRMTTWLKIRCTWPRAGWWLLHHLLQLELISNVSHSVTVKPQAETYTDLMLKIWLGFDHCYSDLSLKNGNPGNVILTGMSYLQEFKTKLHMHYSEIKRSVCIQDWTWLFGLLQHLYRNSKP